MPWSFNCLRSGDPRFVLVGFGCRLEGRVRDGRMDGALFRGLLALEQPANRELVTDPWQVTVPHRFASLDNTGAERKAMVLKCATGASATILFDETIPAELVRDLRAIFRDNRGGGPEDAPPEEKRNEGNQPRRKPSAKDQKRRGAGSGRPSRKRADVRGQRVQ